MKIIETHDDGAPMLVEIGGIRFGRLPEVTPNVSTSAVGMSAANEPKYADLITRIESADALALVSAILKAKGAGGCAS